MTFFFNNVLMAGTAYTQIKSYSKLVVVVVVVVVFISVLFLFVLFCFVCFFVFVSLFCFVLMSIKTNL